MLLQRNIKLFFLLKHLTIFPISNILFLVGNNLLPYFVRHAICGNSLLPCFSHRAICGNGLLPL